MFPSDHSRPVHVPVMPREVLRELQLRDGLTVLDGTAGAAGHSSLILSKIGPSGCLIAMDRDPMMLAFARTRLNSPNCHLVQNSYVHAVSALAEAGKSSVDRVLLDLGLSSDQLADRQRGFGFDAGGSLDMRFDPTGGQSAAELLANCDQSELARIFSTWGEEPQAERIAAEIVKQRHAGRSISTAEALSDLLKTVLPASRGGSTRNPAARVFQALRIAVNDELEHVTRMMTDILPQIMAVDGLAVIITFHSLEDRIVKSAFKGQQGWQVLTKTPVEATPAEVRLNPRARSAKLRVVRRVAAAD